MKDLKKKIESRRLKESFPKRFLFNIDKDFVAKKSLGQNFLHAPQVVSAMVYSAKISADDTVLEAGPGKGILTEALLETGAHVIAVEKDDRAIPFLKEKFKDHIEKNNLKIIHGDILEFDPATEGLLSGNYIIVANIPYYISGEFLRKFLETPVQPSRIVVMLQKELAKRIVDEKGSILSISVKVYGNTKYITTVPRKFFRPVPNVDSAVLLIDNISKKFFDSDKSSNETDLSVNKMDEKSLFGIVKSGFAHKRKVLVKNLENKMTSTDLKNLWIRENWSLNIRAEELDQEQWRKIAIYYNSLRY